MKKRKNGCGKQIIQILDGLNDNFSFENVYDGAGEPHSQHEPPSIPPSSTPSRSAYDSEVQCNVVDRITGKGIALQCNAVQ